MATTSYSGSLPGEQKKIEKTKTRKGFFVGISYSQNRIPLSLFSSALLPYFWKKCVLHLFSVLWLATPDETEDGREKQTKSNQMAWWSNFAEQTKNHNGTHHNCGHYNTLHNSRLPLADFLLMPEGKQFWWNPCNFVYSGLFYMFAFNCAAIGSKKIKCNTLILFCFILITRWQNIINETHVVSQMGNVSTLTIYLPATRGVLHH